MRRRERSARANGEVCTPFPLSEAELRARLSPGTTTVTRDVLEGRVVVEQVERDALQTALKRRRVEKEVRTFECPNVIALPSRRCFVKKSKREKGEYEMRALAVVTKCAFAHSTHANAAVVGRGGFDNEQSCFWTTSAVPSSGVFSRLLRRRCSAGRGGEGGVRPTSVRRRRLRRWF